MNDSEPTVNGRTFVKTHAQLLNYGAMFLLLVAIGIYSSFWGELVPAGNGLGWDGVRYGRWVKDLHVSEIGPYYLQRLFPIALVHYALVLFRAPLVDATVISAFRVANLSLILLACLVWILIANHLEISMRGKWLGFAGLFLNFAVLKQAFYYPVLTDIPAFVLGLFAVYFFLKNNVWALFFVTLIAAFTWPMIVCTGVLFLLFPRKPIKPVDANLFSVTIAGLITAVYFGAAAYFYFIRQWTTLVYGEEKVLDSVVYLSLVLSMFLLFGATLVLTRKISFTSVSLELRRFEPMRLVMAGLIVVIETIFVLTPSAQVGETSGETHVAAMHILLLAGIALLSIAKPLITFVSHVVYFGPIIILLALKWKTFSEEARKYGIGLISAILLSIFVGMDPESRHSIGAFPVFVPFLVKAIDRGSWRSYFYWVFGVVALFFSKVWFDINSASKSATPLGIALQSYFMNHGCYMSLYSYVLQGSVILVAVVIFYYLLRRQPSVEAANPAT